MITISSESTLFQPLGLLDSFALSLNQPNERFKDCFGRPIAIGDVLAHGFRAGCNGGINVGIVYGFTDSTIQVYRVAEIVHYEQKPGHRWSEKVIDGFKLVKGNVRRSENTFITGLTEAQLRQDLGIVSGTMGSSINYVGGYDVEVIAIDEASND